MTLGVSKTQIAPRRLLRACDTDSTGMFPPFLFGCLINVWISVLSDLAPL